MDIRTGEHDQTTRFVLELSEPVKYRVFLLPDPYRVVIDLPLVTWSLGRDVPVDRRSIIQRYRYGQFTAETSRVVLDINGPAIIHRDFTLAKNGSPGHRIVIDLKSTSRKTFMAAVAKQRQQRRKSATPVPAIKPNRADQKWVVVVDPGHGGIDPGASSLNGLFEKKLVLSVGKELARQLTASGRYQVVMTRRRDRFLSLKQRVSVARRSQADLFISIHADTIANRKVRGATVYTLSETASDKEAEELARKENTADIIAGVDLTEQSDEVTGILIDLAQRETMNLSAGFAEMLVPELGKAMVLRTKSHRFAGFRVLKAPDVPSVLVELGYLSNRSDERFLRSKKGQRALSKAIVNAVDRYFSRRGI